MNKVEKPHESLSEYTQISSNWKEKQKGKPPSL